MELIDRVPTQPGRRLITPDPSSGIPPYYATITRADLPTEPGTPLIKANLLTDTTETNIWPAANNRTLNEAFLALSRNPAYGTCASTGSANPKVVNIPNFVLRNPVYVAVTFTYQPDSNFYLNVTSTGAKQMRFMGEEITSRMIPEGYTAFFVYEGTYFRLLNPFGVGGDVRKSVWFVTETGSLTVPENMKLKLTAIGQGGVGGTGGQHLNNIAGGSGGGGGGCSIDERSYLKNDVITISVTSVSTTATCSARGLNIAANAGGAGVAPQTVPAGGTLSGGIGGTATGGNISNITGGAGAAGNYGNANNYPAPTVTGCAGGGAGGNYSSFYGGDGGKGDISCGNGGFGSSADFTILPQIYHGNGGSNIYALFGGNGGQQTVAYGGIKGGNGGNARFMAGSGGDGINATNYGYAGNGGDGGNASKFYDFTSAFGWYGRGGNGGKGGNGNSTYVGGGGGGKGGSGAIGGNGGNGGNGYSSGYSGPGGDGGNSDMMNGMKGQPASATVGGVGGLGGWSVSIGKFPPIANYGGGNYQTGRNGLPLLIIEEV